MPRPSKCHLELNISWESSSYRDVGEVLFLFCEEFTFDIWVDRVCQSFLSEAESRLPYGEGSSVWCPQERWRRACPSERLLCQEVGHGLM